MLKTAKNSKQVDAEIEQSERRKCTDRRTSKGEIRFPFINKDYELVMKDRRASSRRTSDKMLFNNPLKIVGRLFQK